MLLDASFADHWPDIVVASFLAAIGWILRRDISAMDKRHERAEDKFTEQDKVLGDHETRITVVEKTRDLSSELRQALDEKFRARGL